MKKLCIMFMIIIVFLGTVPCFATQGDIFYYPQSDMLQKNVEEQLYGMRKHARISLRAWAEHDGEAEPNIKDEEITFDTDKVYCRYQWTPEAALNFLRAETVADKKAVLSSLKKLSYLFPTYIKGERELRFAIGVKDKTAWGEAGIETADNPWQLAVYDKDIIVASLEDVGISGYEILTAFNYQGLLLALTQKDGEDFCIILPDNDLMPTYLKDLKEKEAALVKKRVLTVSEAELLFNSYRELYGAGSTVSDAEVAPGVGGAAQTETPAAGTTTDTGDTGTDDTVMTDINPDEEPTGGIEPIWFVIGGAALLIAAAVAIALLTKKKAK